jgi:hypothetical protein
MDRSVTSPNWLQPQDPQRGSRRNHNGWILESQHPRVLYKRQPHLSW